MTSMYCFEMKLRRDMGFLRSSIKRTLHYLSLFRADNLRRMLGEIWLIRHGETEWSRAGKHTSSTDLELTKEGERKAATVGRMLAGRAFALVLGSPMRRALATSKLAGYSAEITADLC